MSTSSTLDLSHRTFDDVRSCVSLIESSGACEVCLAHASVPSLSALGHQLGVLRDRLTVVDVRGMAREDEAELASFVASMSGARGKLRLVLGQTAQGTVKLLLNKVPENVELGVGPSDEDVVYFSGKKPTFGVVAQRVKEGAPIEGIRRDIDNAPDKEAVHSTSTMQLPKKPWEK